MGFTSHLFGKKYTTPILTPVLSSPQNIIFQLESQVEQSYNGGAIWKDLINNKIADFAGDVAYNSIDTSIKFFNAANAALNLSPENYINVSAGTDISYGAFIRINLQEDRADPGLWRSGGYTGSAGNCYMVFKRGTGVPNIRWNGLNILNVSTGPAVVQGEWIYILFVIKSGQWAKIYFDGIEKYAFNHTAVTPTFDIRYLNTQYNFNQCLLADYKGMHFYNKTLSAGEALDNSNNLRTFYNL